MFNIDTEFGGSFFLQKCPTPANVRTTDDTRCTDVAYKNICTWVCARAQLTSASEESRFVCHATSVIVKRSYGKLKSVVVQGATIEVQPDPTAKF